jgi:hypothetical protein
VKDGVLIGGREPLFVIKKVAVSGSGSFQPSPWQIFCHLAQSNAITRSISHPIKPLTVHASQINNTINTKLFLWAKAKRGNDSTTLTTTILIKFKCVGEIRLIRTADVRNGKGGNLSVIIYI